jgi:hypothetical protein
MMMMAVVAMGQHRSVKNNAPLTSRQRSIAVCAAYFSMAAI